MLLLPDGGRALVCLSRHGHFVFPQVKQTSGVGTDDCCLILKTSYTHTPTRLPLESKLSYWAVIRWVHWVIRGHVTWPRWGTAPSSPPALASHPAASCREPGGSEGPPLWSCRWPGRRWSRSGGTISALRSTGNDLKISVSPKLQYFNKQLWAVDNIPRASSQILHGRWQQYC